jgi:ribosomal protein S21
VIDYEGEASRKRSEKEIDKLKLIKSHNFYSGAPDKRKRQKWEIVNDVSKREFT